MQARLSVLAGLAAPPTCDLSPAQQVCLGRNRNNTVILRDQHASRLHAVIFFQNNRWHLRDCDTTNGTRLNGQKILETVPLENGAQIGIGDIRLSFTMEPTVEAPAVGTLIPADEPLVVGPDDSHQTTLHADELSSLVKFMNASLKEISPRGLLELALRVVQGQTGADLCGFLNLDVDDPLPRVVVPAEAEVDTQLSKQLTQRSIEANRSIWLAALGGGGDSDSLAAFSDAICIPLRSTPNADPSAPPGSPDTALGALHVYMSKRAFSERQFRFCEVLAGCLANSLRVLRARRALEADNSRLRIQSSNAGNQLVGTTAAMQQVRQQIARLASYNCTVLVVGESGVGKELVALGLHHLSSRHEGPLIPVNCAAIVGNMAEAELFGHEKGAYTDAHRSRPGHFQLADEGTLFLDEIGELSLECQAKLLRVLETKSFRPVGADRPITVDVRVVAATNRDLEKEVREGKFRKDLLFRLGLSIKVPALREHAEDIPALAEYFLTRLNAEYRRRLSLSEGAMQRLMSHSWPGNVRQLRSVLETAVAMTEGDVIMPSDLRLGGEAPPKDRPPSLALDELEAWAIVEALKQTEGNNTQAAKVLGIHRDTLITKMKKYKIERHG